MSYIARLSLWAGLSLGLSCGGTKEFKPRVWPKVDHKLDEVKSTRVQSSAMRRLSIHELRNSIQSLTGVTPLAFEQLPPDSLSYSFDRVVNGQTISPAHLDAYFAIAAETTDRVLNERRLDQLSEACSDALTPPARTSALTTINGNALSLGPAWAVTAQKKAQASRTLYAPDPVGTYTHQFESVGDYALAFSFDASAAVNLDIRLDGESIYKKKDLKGAQVVKTSFTVSEARGQALQFNLSTEPDLNNLDVLYRSVTLEGPLDRKATQLKDERIACVDGLINGFAPLAYRRPLEEEERTKLRTLFDSVNRSSGYIDGLRTLLQSILTSPHFIYLALLGEEVDLGVYKLTSTEMASRLSYALCEEPPDDALRAAAQAGELNTSAQIRNQAQRLFRKPCAKKTVLRFFEHWLWLNRMPTLNKSPEAFPEYTSEVRDGMLKEAKEYLETMVWDEKADLQSLLTAKHSWPDPRSVFLYGRSGLGSKTKTTLPKTRAGVLTLPAVLAVTSVFDSTSPVKRGVFVLEQLLCDKPPSPPAEFDVTPPLPDPKATTRERWAFHTGPKACASCHLDIDPIGFAFEEFDSIGRHRKTENGIKVDAVGGIPSIGVPDGSIRGAALLVRELASSPQVASCMAKQWLRFSLGRMETLDDKSTLDLQTQAFQEKPLREAMLQIVTSKSFSYRRESSAK